MSLPGPPSLCGMATTAKGNGGEELRVYDPELSHALGTKRRAAAAAGLLTRTLSLHDKVQSLPNGQAAKRPSAGGRAVARGRFAIKYIVYPLSKQRFQQRRWCKGLSAFTSYLGGLRFDSGRCNF